MLTRLRCLPLLSLLVLQVGAVCVCECSSDSNQCLTVSKIIATILVTAGIVIFTFGKQRIASVVLPTIDRSSGQSNYICFLYTLFLFVIYLVCF